MPHVCQKRNLVWYLRTSLLFVNLLRLLLFSAEESADPGQRLGRDDETSRDYRLAASDITVPAAFLVLGAVCVEEVVLSVTRQLERITSGIEYCALDLFGLLLDNGEFLVNFAQTLVTEGVGLGNIGGDVAVGL
jgi:hypothetical protein